MTKSEVNKLKLIKNIKRNLIKIKQTNKQTTPPPQTKIKMSETRNIKIIGIKKVLITLIIFYVYL